MSLSRAPTERRIQSLDSLRGVAILTVVGSHFVPTAFPGPASPALIAVGRGGVILFFLLSGYLIFRNLQGQPIPAFMLRRLFKILPSYWLNLACILVLGGLSGSEHYSKGTYVTNFLMISDVTHDAVSSVYWTLVIEIKFYLFIAVQYALLKDRGLPAIVGGLLGLGLISFAARGHGSLLLACFPVFYVGIYAYRAEQANWRGPAVSALVIVTLACAAVMLVTLTDFPTWSAAYLILGTAALVLFLRQQLGHRLLGFLGATSYNNYLYHCLVWQLVFNLFDLYAPGVGAGLRVIVAFIASVAIAVAFYGLVEQPLVRFGRRHENAILGLVRVSPGPEAQTPTPP